jgi:hypothetical protein
MTAKIFSLLGILVLLIFVETVIAPLSPYSS